MFPQTRQDYLRLRDIYEQKLEDLFPDLVSRQQLFKHLSKVIYWYNGNLTFKASEEIQCTCFVIRSWPNRSRHFPIEKYFILQWCCFVTRDSFIARSRNYFSIISKSFARKRGGDFIKEEWSRQNSSCHWRQHQR